ncbi:hypothetical protein EG352_07885 [Chryseobacterium indologenes]|uniref:Tetratricopeptide repeat protein n=2 Tax=Chryseobacterium indologenes TaxID=253 RepID=A0AAD0YUH3_CHRID|nr:hypothetical protein [Chryseobacterium indologenes]AZB17693.1 hypothetical protein EG352_07885 [Chryseobacterium indologenes]
MKTFLFILFLPIFVSSQNFLKQNIDSKIKQINDEKFQNTYGDDKVLAICQELYDLSREDDNKMGMLIAISKRAQIFVNRSDNNACLKLMPEALSLSESLNDYYYKTALYESKGTALTMAADYDNARKSFSNALAASNSIKDKDQLHFKKSSVYLFLVDYCHYAFEASKNKIYKDSMTYFAKNAYSEAIKISDKYTSKNKRIGQSLRIMGSIAAFNNKLADAEKYLDQAEQIILKENDQNSIFALYMERGRMEIDHKKDPQKALEYYNKGLVIAKQLNRPRFYLPIYEFMADYYQKTKNPDMELYYVKKNKRLNDSLVIINQSALLSQNRISKKEALEEYKEIHTNTKKILLIGVMVIIIFTGFLMYYVKKRKKTPPVLFREKSENGSANKNMDETLQKNLPDQSQISTLFESAKTNDKNFLITFQQTFPELYQKLLKLNTELTPNDIELCAFLKLNIQTKEIALYKKSSIGSVDNRKYRLRKKLNLTSETNLYIWINEL